jgi:hypothetical protein
LKVRAAPFALLKNSGKNEVRRDLWSALKARAALFALLIGSLHEAGSV